MKAQGTRKPRLSTPGLPKRFSFVLLWGLILQAATTTGAEANEALTPGLFRLSDGRLLEYARCGDPEGALVLYFHGTPGSHLELHAAMDEISSSVLQIIAINRPGIGSSSFQCNRQIVDWPSDVCELLVGLGLGNHKIGIIGFSGGAPYALVCASAIPDRVCRLAIVSGHTSLGIPGVVPGSEDKSIALLVRRPSLATQAVKVTRRRLYRNSGKVISRVTRKWDHNDRRLIACDPTMRGLLEGSLKQATLAGAHGVVHDARLLGRPWGFHLSSIDNIPISIWHGGCDRIATLSMAEYFHSQLPDSCLHVDPQAGHVSMFKWHCQEILQEFYTCQPGSSP